MVSKLLFEISIEPFNYAFVFGCFLGIAMIVELESLVSTGLTFVRGWRSS